VLSLPELDARLRTFLVEGYNHRAHSETHVARQVRWQADGFLPRLPDSLEQLDLLLLTVAKPRRVHQDGIHFQGFRYIDLTLAAYVGEDVTIRYDPRDMAEVRVYFGENFLCRAINPEPAGETVALKDTFVPAIGVGVNSARPWPSVRQLSRRCSTCDVAKTRTQCRCSRSPTQPARRRQLGRVSRATTTNELG
jgi:hypothetical protein